jgi:2-dehydropantoate 2-reductase
MSAFGNVFVIGGGAIGSVYASRLAASHDVTLVGRPDHVAAITRAGLRVVGREQRTVRLRAVERLTAIPPEALVLLTTKVQDNESAVRGILDLLRPDSVILCVQNGLHGERIVQSILGGRCRVLRAVTMFGAIFKEPGVVDLRFSGWTLIEDSPVSADIAAALTACGLDGRVVVNIAAEVWRKLIYNCVINPITTMIGSDVGSIADPNLDPLKRLVIDECERVARAEGVTLDDDFMAGLTEIYGSSRNIASMRQDVLKGRPTEIHHMNGAIVRVGAGHGIDCRVNTALVDIIAAMERLGTDQGTGTR